MYINRFLQATHAHVISICTTHRSYIRSFSVSFYLPECSNQVNFCLILPTKDRLATRLRTDFTDMFKSYSEICFIPIFAFVVNI